jgi:hypothetical protein
MKADGAYSNHSSLKDQLTNQAAKKPTSQPNN